MKAYQNRIAESVSLKQLATLLLMVVTFALPTTGQEQSPDENPIAATDEAPTDEATDSAKDLSLIHI